ncbi:MAG: hypothetical protein IPL79_08805 [Myxococcales bacterium]|nr:hypothetical protein [Myxococcales bacterium]
MGASVSFGYQGWAVSDAWHTALPDAKITALADAYFYLDPIENAQTQAATMAQTKAELVIAIDYLFWLGYSSGAPLSTIQYGLTALEALDDGTRMIVVGDMPQLDAGGGYLLSDEQIEAIHDHLIAWADGREGVLIVPLSEWSALLRSGEPVTLPDGSSVPTTLLMNDDDLHPTALGTWFMLDRVDELLAARFPQYDPDLVEFARPQ